MFLTQICHLLHALLLCNKLFPRLLLTKESDLSGRLLEDALSPVRKIIHHFQGQLLDHLIAIGIGGLCIIVTETLSHCSLSIVNRIAQRCFSLLILNTSKFLILLH